jgi:hypothetical protein
MSRALTKIAYCVCIAFLGAVLAGCAETTYPNLPDLSPSTDRLLTPTEQQKAIRDLSGERAQTGETDKPN